jgi:hypothetical protein
MSRHELTFDRRSLRTGSPVCTAHARLLGSVIMDRLENHFWDFMQDHLPYSLYDALYMFAGHLSTVFYWLNRFFTYTYKAV